MGRPRPTDRFTTLLPPHTAVPVTANTIARRRRPARRAAPALTKTAARLPACITAHTGRCSPFGSPFTVRNAVLSADWTRRRRASTVVTAVTASPPVSSERSRRRRRRTIALTPVPKDDRRGPTNEHPDRTDATATATELSARS